MPNDELLAALGRLYPAGRLLAQAAELIPYESDALTAYRGRPIAAVIPENAEEVIETVRLCHRHGVPFVARGSGTSLSGGSLPVGEGVLIVLNRLNRILRLDPRERLAVVEPGVINLDVSRAAAPYGLYYAPDPSSQTICTIGGNVAFNSGGAHCLKYGMTGNHVLGIKAVLPDGEVVELGGESLEGVGPDLAGLFVGSEGLFGIALEITLRLLPRPELYRTVLAAYDSLEAAGDAVAAVVAAGSAARRHGDHGPAGDPGRRGRRARQLSPRRGRGADRRARRRGAAGGRRVRPSEGDHGGIGRPRGGAWRMAKPTASASGRGGRAPSRPWAA